MQLLYFIRGNIHFPIAVQRTLKLQTTDFYLKTMVQTAVRDKDGKAFRAMNL